MAIYQRCQQPTSRKVLLHPLPLPLPACAHLPHDRLHVAIKLPQWRRGRAAATLKEARREPKNRNQKQIQVPPPPWAVEHDAALTRTSVYVKIQYVMHLVSCLAASAPAAALLLPLRRLSVPPRAPSGLDCAYFKCISHCAASQRQDLHVTPFSL